MRRVDPVPACVSADGGEAYLVGGVNSNEAYVVRRLWGHDAKPPTVGPDEEAYYTVALVGPASAMTFSSVRAATPGEAEGRAVSILRHLERDGNLVRFEAGS